MSAEPSARCTVKRRPGFNDARRAHRTAALRIEHGGITALQRALRTQHFEPCSKRVDSRKLTFMLA